MDTSIGLLKRLALSRDFLKCEHSQDCMANGIALYAEPLATAEGVTPALERSAAGILTGKQVFGPLRVR
jgi:hypothetical protein